MKKSILILFFMQSIFCAYAQDKLRFGGGGQFGVSILQTSYRDILQLPGDPPEDREYIFSAPRVIYGIFGMLDYKLSDIFTLNSNLSLLKNGYQYKIHNYLEQDYVKATYNRFELGVEFGIKSYVFSKEKELSPLKKSYKKRGKRKRKQKQLKRRQQRAPFFIPYLFTGYQIGIRISENYDYANIDRLQDLNSKRRKFLHGYCIGFGLEKENINLLIYLHSDVSDFIKGDEVNDYYLKDFGLKTTYFF